jgi:hypothetical protein
MIPPIPDFDEALGQLRGFIAQVGHPCAGDLAWLFREDVSTQRRRVLVKVPLPPGNEGLARELYERGRALAIGVCLDVYCRLGPALCCTCWFVRDAEESARRLCWGLKLSVPAPGDLPVARPVRNGLLWAVLCWLDSRSGLSHFSRFLPSRDEPPPGTADPSRSGCPAQPRGGRDWSV